MNRRLIWTATLSALFGTVGCNAERPQNEEAIVQPPDSASPQRTTVRIHINGFMKSKSGAI